MFETCRPLGRLFLCTVFVLAMVAASNAAPQTTTVADVIYRADGTPAKGTLLISWPAFVSADGEAVSAGSLAVGVGPSGAVNVALVPNEGATPAGTYYSVVMKLDDGNSAKEFWTVPLASPATIAQIRSVIMPQSVAAQIVSKQDFEKQIAQKANDDAVVHSVGGETISGVKQFAMSPRVPSPVAGPDVANKDYVDAAVGQVGDGSYVSRAGDAMSGPLVLSGDPVSSNQAANRHYVDVQVAGVSGAIAGKESLFNKDQANGYAGLDGSGYVGNSHLGAGATDSTKCLKGDHSWGACGMGGDSSTTIRYVTSDYNWVQSPSSPSSISAGANTVTISPCPKGVDPTAIGNHYVRIAGTGTAESALVTGGTTCSSGSLTLTFTAANTHGAGYTVGSATGGLQEVLNDARFKPTNPNGSWQSGKVIVPPGEYRTYAPTYVQGTNQTVDFTGSIVECNDGAHACIYVGNPANSGSYQNITIINPKGRPMVASGTNPFIQVNAQATKIIKPLTRAPLSGNTFGYLVQVDDDQAFEAEGIDPSSGDALRCDSTFCGSAVYAPGPFAGNAAVGWIHDSNITLNCRGNGIEWQAGNSLKISDSIIQGYNQFAVKGGKRGGYGGIVLDNVYSEVGVCQNPLGNIGQAGVLSQGHKLTIMGEAESAPSGQFPVFANTGSTKYQYWVIATHATYGDSIPLPAGYANTDGATAVTVTWYKIAGATSFKVLRMTWDGTSFNRPYPIGTGNYLIGTVLASSCTGSICTFSDTHAAPSSTTTASAAGIGQWYFPLLDFWPGSVVMSASGDSDQPGDTSLIYSQAYPGNPVLVNSPNLAGLFVQDCTIGATGMDSNAPIAMIHRSCQNVQGSSQNAYQLGGMFLGNKGVGDGGAMTGIKGRLNFGTFGSGPVDIVTWYDTALGKTFTDPYGRPSWDTDDAATGMEDSGQLYNRASSALRGYVGKTPDGAPQEELTATQKKFNVPVAFKEVTPPSNPPAGQQIVYAKSGGFCSKDSAGNEKCMGATGSGGVTAFTGLSDVPNSYVSQKYKLVRVASGETALEFLGVPDCSNATTSKLLYNATTGVWSCGTDQSSSGGATAFTALSDAPNSYASQGGKMVRVNTGATGLEFIGIPDCSNATTSKLLYNASTSTWSCGTDQAAAGGSNVVLAPSAEQVIRGTTGDFVPFVIRGSAAGQVQNLQEWRDGSTASVLASVGADGTVTVIGGNTYGSDAIHLGGTGVSYAQLALESSGSQSIRFKHSTNDFEFSNMVSAGVFNFKRWNATSSAYEEVFHLERTSNDVYFQGRVVLGAHEFFGSVMAAPANPGTGNYVLWVDSTTNKLSCKYASGADCTPSSGSESTPALSEDATTVTSTKTIVAPNFQSNATTDQSYDLPTAVSPALSAAGHGKFSFQASEMYLSENGGAYAKVLKSTSSINATQLPSPLNDLTSNGVSHNFLGVDGTTPPLNGYLVAMGPAGDAINGPLVSSLLINPMVAIGDLIYGDAGGVMTRLPANTSTTTKYLCETGAGGAGAAPTWCTGTSSGGNGAILNSWCNGAVSSGVGAVLVLAPASISSTSTACTANASTATQEMVLPYACTAKNLYAVAKAAGTTATSGTITLKQNGAASALTCAMGTGTSCNDTTHTVAMSAGDTWSVTVTTGSSSPDTTANIRVAIQCQ